MNLGKLLATGKSIINSRGGAAYRENKRVYLPKFEPVRNPFQPSSVTPASKDSSKPISPPAKAQSVSASCKVLEPAGSWSAKLNSLGMFHSAAAPTARVARAEQIELALGQVRVLQNDLCDAEVEVVPIKSSTVPSAGPARPGGIRAAHTASAWSDLGFNMFEVNAV